MILRSRDQTLDRALLLVGDLTLALGYQVPQRVLAIDTRPKSDPALVGRERADDEHDERQPVLVDPRKNLPKTFHYAAAAVSGRICAQLATTVSTTSRTMPL